MMSTRGLVMATLLAVSQISTLSLDFVHVCLGVFKIAHIGGGHLTWILHNCKGI
eukprot:Gb_28818 [translate_table: standard]